MIDAKHSEAPMEPRPQERSWSGGQWIPIFEHLLACPQCGTALERTAAALSCPSCQFSVPLREAGAPPDFRIRSSIDKTMAYTPIRRSGIAQALRSEISNRPWSALGEAASGFLTPKNQYGNRLSKSLLSHMPESGDTFGFMLDIGCGDRPFEAACRAFTGLEYVGVDYEGIDPDILADAHALPFADASFDLVMSFAVLEHLSAPDIAMAEAFRVLKPGGRFIGSVAFLEPFHMNSYFHMTHLGVARVLETAGFELVELAPNQRWDVFRAQSDMAYFPGRKRPLGEFLLGSARLVSQFLGKVGDAAMGRPRPDGLLQTCGTTGGFRFVAQKA